MAGWKQPRRRRDRWLASVLALVVVASVLAVGLVVRLAGSREGDLIVGAVGDPLVWQPAPSSDHYEPVPVPGTPAGTDDGDTSGAGRPRLRTPGPPSGQRLLDPSGRPYGAPIPFNGDIPVPVGLVWVLLVGSDARPGEPILRARADSIHLLAANPATGQATIIGVPRDAYVEIPGHGAGKINTALTLGGPELLAATVHRFTGLPVQYWVAAGFETFRRVVDEVGGVDVEVAVDMDDRDSGAHFRAGFHHFDGAAALAFSRDRHEFSDGDLTRSLNHGVVMLAALAKLRSEVGDEAGLRRWVGVALRHLHLTIDAEQALRLLAVARRTDPADVTNLVLQGRGAMVGAQSVILVDARAAARIADDVRPDAAIGPPKLPPATVPITAPTTTTTTATTTTLPPATTTTGAPPPSTEATLVP